MSLGAEFYFHRFSRNFLFWAGTFQVLVANEGLWLKLILLVLTVKPAQLIYTCIAFLEAAKRSPPSPLRGTSPSGYTSVSSSCCGKFCRSRGLPRTDVRLFILLVTECLCIRAHMNCGKGLEDPYHSSATAQLSELCYLMRIAQSHWDRHLEVKALPLWGREDLGADNSSWPSCVQKCRVLGGTSISRRCYCFLGQVLPTGLIS